MSSQTIEELLEEAHRSYQIADVSLETFTQLRKLREKTEKLKYSKKPNENALKFLLDARERQVAGTISDSICELQNKTEMLSDAISYFRKYYESNEECALLDKLLGTSIYQRSLQCYALGRHLIEKLSADESDMIPKTPDSKNVTWGYFFSGLFNRPSD